MTSRPHHLTYQLVDGYVDDWLVLGPLDEPVQARPGRGESELAFRARLLRSSGAMPEVPLPPMELEKLGSGDAELFWDVVHCPDDHLLDRSGFLPAYTRRRVWAFVRLASPVPQAATLHLTTTCPAIVWLNGEQVASFERLTALDDQAVRTEPVAVALSAGDDDLLVQLEQVGVRDVAVAVALRVEAGGTVEVHVPTITPETARRQELERLFASTYLDRAVYTGEERVSLVCPEELGGEEVAVLRLQKPDGTTFGETRGTLRPGAIIQSLRADELPGGELQARLMASYPEFYEQGIRSHRILPFWATRHPYAFEPTGTPDERLVELLETAARADDGLVGETAKVALGRWDGLDPRALRDAIDRVKRGQADSLPDLVGLLGLRQRAGRRGRLPSEVTSALDQAILGFDYSGERTGQLDPGLECDQILVYVGQVLAGQLLPRARFGASGLTGLQERNRGEELAIGWLKRRAQTGFAQWDSHLDLVVVALSYLVDLARSEPLRELAAALLDKVLFGLAVNSLQGTFGSSQGDARASTIRSGRLAPESALNRLLWGTGSYDGDLMGPVSLGLVAREYQLPELIRTIALDPRPEALGRERNLIPSGQAGQGSKANGAEIDKVTYKTPDYVLSSAQDYRPGQRGRREHIWQATLGPEALVFTNHPSCESESEGRAPGWWRGNGSLPRVAQWKDSLIALYQLPEDDWLGFTHAYFPRYAFDEHAFEQGWAFARKQDAYLALCALPGFQPIERGVDAYRELRSVGPRHVWLCQMGRQEVDGSFGEFRRRVLGGHLLIEGLRVEWETARGDRLEFDWTGPLVVNGQEQALAGFRHFENPYAVAEMPALTMDIGYGQKVMRLSLE